MCGWERCPRRNGSIVWIMFTIRRITASVALLLAMFCVIGAVAPSANAVGSRWSATVGTKGTEVSYSAPACQGSDGRIDYTIMFNVATPCHFG